MLHVPVLYLFMFISDQTEKRSWDIEKNPIMENYNKYIPL